MPTFNHTRIYGIKDILHQVELSGSFSITKDGLHFEIVKSEETIAFKIFDLMSTELLQQGEISEGEKALTNMEV